MTVDVCILAGGYGTRLRGFWDGPKCLVPVDGMPVLEHLIKRTLPFSRQILLLLGHKADEVLAWKKNSCPHNEVIPVIQNPPEGVTRAICAILHKLTPPVLILNGDTLPSYDLNTLLHAARIMGTETPITAAWCGSVYAGAAVFQQKGLDFLITGGDLDTLIADVAAHYRVSGFLDVGTPATFTVAQTRKRELPL